MASVYPSYIKKSIKGILHHRFSYVKMLLHRLFYQVFPKSAEIYRRRNKSPDINQKNHKNANTYNREYFYRPHIQIQIKINKTWNQRQEKYRYHWQNSSLQYSFHHIKS